MIATTETQLIPTSFDYETRKFAAGCIAPPPICLSWGSRANLIQRSTGDITESIVDAHLVANGDGADLDQTVHHILATPTDLIVGCNIAYDLSCTVANWPELMTSVWAALVNGRVHDVQIREKLLNLAEHGKLDFVPLPDGSAMRVNYGLAELEKSYLGIDRSEDKKQPDAWRWNYEMLDGKPSSEYPEEARNYSLADAEGTLLVWEAQEARAAALRNDYGIEAFPNDVQERRVAAAFALRLSTCWGVAIDHEKKAEIEAELRKELAPERMLLCIKAGLVRPAVPGRLYRGRMTKGKDESINRKRLIEIVTAVCEANELPLKRNDPTENMLAAGIEEGNVCADKEVLEEIKHLDPVLEQYAHRQYFQKLVNTELPRMSGPIVYPCYDILKETGRISSYAADEYPSCNITNVANVKKLFDEDGKERGEIEVRECYVPRPGHVFCSVDYASLEFVSMAQQCWKLFKHSVMRDLLNAGRDPHGYLGARIAYEQEPSFRSFCDAEGARKPLELLDCFEALKKSPEKEHTDFYEQYRKLAKPVGFGFPGGLGVKRFVGFARAHPYYVRVTEEQAKLLKELWLDTFTEMPLYFDWVESGCKTELAADGDRRGDRYAYFSPLGMLRSKCNYTACCNGALLQTPAAEGAVHAMTEVSRACSDPSLNSPLLGCHMIAFIHDEIILEIPEDEHMHERGFECSRIMIDAMKLIMPDVAVKAEPALMRRWSKSAKTVYDKAGRLAIWEPK